MKKLLLIAFIFLALHTGYNHSVSPCNPAHAASFSELSVSSDREFATAHRNRKSNLQLSGLGTVVKILPDDKKGSRHQRFIVRLNSGQTLLIAHNIDLAPKVSSLKKGDSVLFRGEYEWSKKGGVIHWTHHDPRGLHEAGWIEHNGQTYQ